MTNKNKHKLFGIIMTIVFHTIAVILLFTLCFRTPLPLPGEAGVEVNLGMYASSSISQQINTTTNQQVNENSSQQEVEETEDILSEDEEVPSIEEEKKESEKTEEVEEKKPEEAEEQEVEQEIIEEKPEEIIEEKPVVNQRAMFKAPTDKKDSASNGESEGENEGEQGTPNGLKDIDRYEGTGGSGGGLSFDLGGRGAKSLSSPTTDFDEDGKIVVDIWVDKEGRVQRAEIGKGTDILDSSMRESALQAAKNSIFNKDDKAADLQKGTITYKFIRRQ